MRKSLFFIFLLLVLGCNREFGKPSWDVGLKAPIIKTSISFDKLIRGNEFFRGTNEGDISYVKYRQNLVKLKIDSLFQLPDTANVQTFQIPVGPINFAPGQVLQEDTLNTKYRLSGIELHNTKFNSGYLALEIISTIQEELEIEYLIPSSNKNGIPFSFITYAPAGSNANPTIFKDTFNLSDYEMDLRGQGKNNFNTITAYFKTAISPNGNNVAINVGEYVSIKTTLVNAIPQYVEGYFKNQNFEVERQSSDAEVFEIFKSGSLTFSKPQISLFVNNELGVDFAANSFNISGENTSNNTEVKLETNVINNLKVSRAFKNPGSDPPYRSNNVTLEINETNSNLPQVLANLPNKIWYDASLQVNPLGNISGYNDFVYYGAGINVGLEVLLPLQFDEINNLVIADTSDYVFTKEDEYDNITGGYLQLLVNNKFDFELTPSLILYDEFGNYLDTLLSPNIAVPKLTQVSIPVPVNQEKIDYLYRGKKMLIWMKLNSNQQNAIEAYVKDEVEITLIADFDYLVKIE